MLIGANMAKLLILGPSYRRNTSPEPLPAIERYVGLFYRIVRRVMDNVEEKNIDIIITEDLELTASETKISYKLPIGNRWGIMSLQAKDSERVEKLRNQIPVKSEKYDEVFIALNEHYQALLLGLTPYTKKIIATSRGLGLKAKELKELLSR